VIGIGIAWAVFVFSGAVSHAILLSLFMTGAGIGAGVGGFIAWLKVDKAPPWPLLLAGALAVVLAGIGGAWGGFQFGANQEVPCCVGPAITPITYTALGATAAANVAALAMGVAHEIRARRGWKRSRAENGSSAVSSSTEARRLAN
jgi:formate-dependent nitrite reductase membrane component NrfD